MTRFLPWLTWLVLLLGGCTAGRSAVAPAASAQKPQRPELTRAQMAELLCQYQLLPVPVPSRLPEPYRLSDLLRKEDVDYLQHIRYAPRTDLDRPGLYAALSRFVECEVGREVDPGDGRAVVSVRYTRPQWEAESLRTREILEPHSPTQRLVALVKWLHDHPETTTTYLTVPFERTPAGWRADLQLPEQRKLRLPEVRTCAAQNPWLTVRPFGPGMRAPRRLTGSWPGYTRDALESRVQGLLIARCRITAQGETKDCCIQKPLPHLEASTLDALSHLRFEPVMYEGEPIDVEYTFNLRFGLPR